MQTTDHHDTPSRELKLSMDHVEITENRHFGDQACTVSSGFTPSSDKSVLKSSTDNIYNLLPFKRTDSHWMRNGTHITNRRNGTAHVSDLDLVGVKRQTTAELVHRVHDAPAPVEDASDTAGTGGVAPSALSSRPCSPVGVVTWSVLVRIAEDHTPSVKLDAQKVAPPRLRRNWALIEQSAPAGWVLLEQSSLLLCRGV